MQARSEQTQRRLMRAGAEMFNQNGYAKATLEQIASAAGMTKGALYFHFASKDGLAEAVQERGRAMLRAFVEEQLRGGASPVQALVDLTHWLARTLYEDPVIRAGFRIAAECGGGQPSSTDVSQAWIHEVRRLLARAREAGELRTDRATDPEGPEMLVAATVCGVEVLSGTGMSCAELRRRVGALWEPLLSALVPPGDEARYRTDPPHADLPHADLPHADLPCADLPCAEPPPADPTRTSPYVPASLATRSTTAA